MSLADEFGLRRSSKRSQLELGPASNHKPTLAERRNLLYGKRSDQAPVSLRL